MVSFVQELFSSDIRIRTFLVTTEGLSFLSDQDIVALPWYTSEDCPLESSVEYKKSERPLDVESRPPSSSSSTPSALPTL